MARRPQKSNRRASAPATPTPSHREFRLPENTTPALPAVEDFAGLVDRYRVVAFPVVTNASGSDRIYDSWPDVRLEVVGSRTFEGGLHLLNCVPTVLERPPGT